MPLFSLLSTSIVTHPPPGLYIGMLFPTVFCCCFMLISPDVDLTLFVTSITTCKTSSIIIFLQETWLAKQTLDKPTDISDNHFACGTAEVDYTKGITSGRPYGGTAILWNKKLNAKIFMNQDQSMMYHQSGGMLRLKLLNFINVYNTCHVAVTPTMMST